MNKVILKVDNDLCNLRAEIDPRIPGVPLLHAEMKSWGSREKRLMEFVWAQFKDALRGMGFRGVCSILPESDVKAQKFNEMFGMRQLGKANGYVLMVQEV